MNYLVLYGCGGHSRSVADVILYNDPSAKLVFVDEQAGESETIFGFHVVNALELSHVAQCFIAIGDNARRKEKFIEIGSARLVTVVSKRAYIGTNATIGSGSFVAHSSHLGPEVVVGHNTILNTGAIIEHESRIGNHTHIGPNATICGRSQIGDSVLIGAATYVADKVRICSHAVIGANSTIISDITEPGTYVGMPARKVK